MFQKPKRPQKKNSKRRALLFLLPPLILLLAAAGFLLVSQPRSQPLLDHTAAVLPEGSVWLHTTPFSIEGYHAAGRASEALLSGSEVEELLDLVQEGWTGEVLPCSNECFPDGFHPLRIWFCEGEAADPRARGLLPQVTFLVYDLPTMERLQALARRSIAGGSAASPYYSYGLIAYWTPTDEMFDFTDTGCAAFYPMTEAGWQALANWMDAKLLAAGTAASGA